MAKGVRLKKYSRRTSRSRSDSHIGLVVLAVLIFIVLCFIISIAIGTVLGRKADDIKEPERNISVYTYYSGERKVKASDAYIYDWDFDISNIWRGKTDFSVCLQNADGSIDYEPQTGTVPYGVKVCEESLSEHVGYIKNYGGYVCAYLYVRSFDSENEYVRTAVRAFEIALANAAASSGADEIMLILPDITDGNITEIEKYVSDMSKSSQGAAVGVLLPPEIYRLTENNVYYASRLRSVCDFAALDLRTATEENVETLISDNEYYINSLALRAVFCEGNSEVADLARGLGVTSIQIVAD